MSERKLILQSGYIVDAILDVKKHSFGEKVVSFNELEIIKEIIEIRLKEKGLNVEFYEGYFENHYFKIFNGLITKIPGKENSDLKSHIQNLEVRDIIYDYELIYWCLCQIMINKLYGSIECDCKVCNKLCPGIRVIPQDKNESCVNYQYNFKQNCINKLSDEEREIIDSLNEKAIIKKLTI